MIKITEIKECIQFYGCLQIAKVNDTHYWIPDDYCDVPFNSYIKIPKYLYDALLKFQHEGL